MSILNEQVFDKLNEQLEGILVYMDVYSNSIQEEINRAGNKAQEVANEKMEEFGKLMSNKLTVIRNRAVDVFSAQYQSVSEKIKPVEPLVDANVSLDTVVDIVKTIINILTAPYQPAIEFMTILIPKVLTLSSNIQKVAAYQPTINVPNVVVPPLNIEVEPITVEDITGK